MNATDAFLQLAIEKAVLSMLYIFVLFCFVYFYLKLFPDDCIIVLSLFRPFSVEEMLIFVLVNGKPKQWHRGKQ